MLKAQGVNVKETAPISFNVGICVAAQKDSGPWEGEQRNMWKPTQVNHLWFHGGNRTSGAPTRSTPRCS